jgi:hypothetical protein
MNDDNKSLNDVKLQVALLAKDIEVTTDFAQRVSLSMEKIQEMSLHLVKMITLHEQRHHQHERTESEIKEDIKELHSRITTQSREIHDRMDQVEHHITSRIDILRGELMERKEQSAPENQKDNKLTDKVESLEKWRWTIVGALFVAGWVLGNMDILGKLLK